ncbi:tetratricopeptide repeat protein, partial [Massilia sp. TS11]|uniref:tetratricopeptide repeat protein n=1 Tax=Massilia sp. TS11 TaxID=2908003 RepID=UPI001EDB083B
LALHTMPPGLYEFDVNGPIPTCGRWKETMPRQRDPDAYRFYIKARDLWRSNFEYLLSRDQLASVLRDVSLAAQRGDWGARATLSHFYINGLGQLEMNKVLEPDASKAVEIYRAAVAAGQAWGFYDLGVAYEHGYGDVPVDSKIAWAYYLKAAELGSPEAQMALAQAYRDAKRWNAEETMQMCAYKQGHGPAAEELGMNARTQRRHVAAFKFYQDGVRFGNDRSAIALAILFGEMDWRHLKVEAQRERRELDLAPDSEREKRYWEIGKALEINPDLRLTRIDNVLPMPPAALPTWKGIESALELERDGPVSY